LSMVFSPDGAYLLAGGRNCEVILWDLLTNTRKVSASMDSSIVAVAYAPSGRYFAAVDMDSDVKVWDSVSLEEVGYESLAPSVLSLAMSSARSEILATGSTSRSVLVLTVPGLEKIAELRHDGHVRSVAFSPDCAYLAGGGGIPDSHGSHGSHDSGGTDQETKTVVWSLGEKTQTLSATDLNMSMNSENGPASFMSDNPAGGFHIGFAYLGAISFGGVVHTVSFSPSGKLLAVGSESHSISLLLVSQGFESAAKLPCRTGTRGLAWCPDSRFLASAGDDLQVCVWDVILERVLFSVPKAKDWLCSMCFSPDSHWLACCGHSGHEVAVYPLRLVDELGQMLQAAQDAVTVVPTVSRKGDNSPSDSDGASSDEDALHVPPEIATAPMRNQVPRITAIAVKDSIDSLSGYELEYRDPKFATRSADSHNTTKGRSATAADSVWGVVVGVLSTSQCFMPAPSRPAQKLAHQDDVLAMAVSSDQRKIAAGGEDQALVVWDLSAMEKLFELKLRHTLAAVTFGSNKSQHLVACAFGTQVALVDTSTQQETGRIQVAGTPLSLAVSTTPFEVLAVGTSASSVMLLSLEENLAPLATLKTGGHVHSLHFSPTANFLVAGGGIDDKCGLMTHKADISGTQAVVWQLDAVSLENSSVHHCTPFSDVVRAVQFSPCGKLLALGGESQTIKVLITEQDHHHRPGFDDGTTLNCMAGVRCLAWSDNSHFLASGGEDMQVSVWDILTGSVAFRLPKSADWISSLAFCSQGAWLATSGFGQCEVVLHPLDKCSNEALDQLDYSHSPAMARRSMFRSGASPHNTPVGSRVNSKKPADYISEPSRADPAARAAAASCISNNTRLLSVMLGMDLGAVTMEVPADRASRQLEHNDEVMSIAFNSNGRRLVAAGEDNRVKLWDLETDQPLLDAKLEASIVAVAYSPNDRYVAAGTSENTLLLWDAGTLEEVITQEEEGGVHALALLSKPQELLAVGLKSKKVLIMSVPGLDTLVELDHGGDVRSVCFSNDGALLTAVGGADDMHGLMTVKSAGGPDRGMRAMVWEVPETGSEFDEMNCLEFNNVLHASAFSPSSKILAVGGESSKISILLVDKHFEQVSELSCAAGVRCLAWSPDSRFLASGGEDLQVCVWDVKSERLVLRLPKARDWLNCLAFSPDSLWLASCGYGSSFVHLHAVQVKHEAEEQLPQQVEPDEADEPEMGGTVSLSMSVPDINAATPTWVKLDDNEGDATLSLAIPMDP